MPVQGGYLDGEYDEVTADLNRDTVVNKEDKALKIPRLAPKSYGASPSGWWALSFYGTNLLDKASLGGNAPLPDTDPPLFFLFGGDGPGPLPPPSFSPLNKGRVLGVHLRISY
jgi:iron complex outermembrane recepter protein